MISERRIDKRFPLGHFKIDGFNTPFRFSCNSSGGGVMFFLWGNIPAKLIGSEKPT